MNFALCLSIACFVLAAIPAIVFLTNLSQFHHFPKANEASPDPVSVLIPARNESATIARAIGSIQNSRGVDFEILVLDDQSTDDTAAIVKAIAQNDERVQLIAAPPLPAGWCGKQHACQLLAEQAHYQTLLWIDADVQLAPDAILLMTTELQQNRAALISGFPFEETITVLEVLLIPLIHFILLGFLPIRMMRRDASPAFAAGCGQLFMARRKDYFEAGGHAAIRASLHDGIMLPRAFRKAGKQTDLFDASDIAQCRMYDSAPAVWNGLLKNATEGIGSPIAIVPWTLLLFGGQVLPLLLTATLITDGPMYTVAIAFAFAASFLGISTRLIAARRFYSRLPAVTQLISAFLHPLAVLLFLVIQWQSLLRRMTGYRPQWKGRAY